MKKLTAFVACTAQVVLPLLFTSCGDSTPPAPAAWVAPLDGTYKPLSRTKRGKLQRALTDCATVELERLNFTGTGPQEWQRKLVRGKDGELEAILARLAAVPHWYAADYGNSPPLVNPALSDTILFRDAEGKVIYRPDTLIFEPCCPGPSGERRDFSSFFPFPSIKIQCD